MRSATKELFFRHVGQTSPSPMGLEVVDAKGVYLFDPEGKKYCDLVSGVSVSNVGHKNKEIVQAIHKQAGEYLHVMVYGEFIQSPQVQYAEKLASLLPDTLNSVYYVNSGSEAVEVALKLAKRYTNRTEIIAFTNAYHGSTHGSMSLMSNDAYTLNFRPLLPDVRYIPFNDLNSLDMISDKTACVIGEVIQGEAGVHLPDESFLKALRKRCNDKGALLLFDEIQTGFGRTGELFAFQNYSIVPDVLIVAKAFGGGMPLGGVISSQGILNSFTHNPMLGHITTFGGHPVCCAAGHASLQFIIDNNLMAAVDEKEQLFRNYLRHTLIKEIRGKGLLLAVELNNRDYGFYVFEHAIQGGFVTDLFLFNETSFRISPPLTITKEEIKDVCMKILKVLDDIPQKKEI